MKINKYIEIDLQYVNKYIYILDNINNVYLSTDVLTNKMVYGIVTDFIEYKFLNFKEERNIYWMPYTQRHSISNFYIIKIFKLNKILIIDDASFSYSTYLVFRVI